MASSKQSPRSDVKRSAALVTLAAHYGFKPQSARARANFERHFKAVLAHAASSASASSPDPTEAELEAFAAGLGLTPQNFTDADEDEAEMQAFATTLGLDYKDIFG